MLERTDLSPSHEEQARLWGWLHEWRKWWFLGSLRAYEVQWSATDDASVTWTCVHGKVGVTSFRSENEFIHQPVSPIFNHLVSQLIIFQVYIEKQVPSNITVRKHSYSSLEFYQCSKLLRIQTVASVFLKLAGGIIRPEMFTLKATLFCEGAQWRTVWC